jgi:hypothetical protein
MEAVAPFFQFQLMWVGENEMQVEEDKCRFICRYCGFEGNAGCS